MVKVTLPEMGESVTQGSIVEFRKKVGDHVTEGDTIVEVTTDKVDVEVPATASGIIARLLVAEGQTISVGAVIAEIDTSGSAASAATAAPNGKPAPVAAAAAPSGPPKIVAVTLPEMGESVTEGSIVEFRKKVGDHVAEGETVVEITTDKVDVEVPAPAAGVITKLVGQPGDTVAVGAVLAELDANAVAAAHDAPVAAKAAATPVAAPVVNAPLKAGAA
ncbi:MAG: biotin/lipoyl-containing protein, partial [Vulcanimicrobiaceae bacterium]